MKDRNGKEKAMSIIARLGMQYTQLEWLSIQELRAIIKYGDLDDKTVRSARKVLGRKCLEQRARRRTGSRHERPRPQLIRGTAY